MDHADQLTTVPQRPDGGKRLTLPTCLAICFALLLCVGAIYLPVSGYSFVNFDDPDYVTENPHVHDGLSWEGVRWAFTTGHASNWHPLTWLSHMLDGQLFGAEAENAGGHHLVNVGLHACSSALLFLMLLRLTQQGWPSALAAMLFAVHPLHVESVAWVSERKDVLSGVFFMLTLLTYGWYTERRTLLRYAFVLAIFSVGLLAKPMLVTVPFVLLLLDIWPLRRLSLTNRDPDTGRPGWFGLIVEKVPLFLLSASSCLVTFFVQRAGGAVHHTESISLSWRFANAAVAYVAYLFKFVWPANLTIMYPHPALDPEQAFSQWLVAGAAATLGLIAVSVAAWRTIRRWPFLAVGWLWYLGMLIPVIGLVQVGLQSRADRYAYLPMIGIYILLAWGLQTLIHSFPKHKLAISCLTVCALVALAVTARRQLAVWKDSRMLFEHSLSVTDNNYVAHNNLGLALEDMGHPEPAIAHYQISVRLNPNYGPANNNFGRHLGENGQFDNAIQHFRQAVRLNSNDTKAHYNWAVALQQIGQPEQAVAHYEKVLRLEPNDVAVHHNLGVVLRELGRVEDSISHHRRAVQINPDFRPAHISLGLAFGEMGRYRDAAVHFQNVVRLDPADARAHYNLGVALETAGQLPKAISHYEEATRLQPDYRQARMSLGEAMFVMGRWQEAAEHVREVLRVYPDDKEAQALLQRIRKTLNRPPAAGAK